MKKRIISGLLTVALTVSLLLTAAPTAQAAVSRTEAYKAYYDFLNQEIDNMGKYIRDPDYYRMFTERAQQISTDKKILAAYLRDVTGDGVEELIYKKLVSNPAGGPLSTSETEWVCVYSYVNGALKRIGQTLSWVQKNGDSYRYYEPAGYIGEVLSSVDHPNIIDDCLYYCKGSDGKPYLADGEPTSAAGEYTFSCYAFNGSLMEKRDTFSAIFAPEWRFGSIKASYGWYVYSLNGTDVPLDTYKAQLAKYAGSSSERLVNNDYHTVLNTLAAAIPSYASHYRTPSSWAPSAVDTAKRAGYLPEELQLKYDQPITRREFCVLAAAYYEKTIGTTITARKTFADTQDLSVQKMGGLGVVDGVGDNKFAPNNSLKRQEAAAILARLSASLGNPLPEGSISYADNQSIAAWAKTAVGQMKAAGIMDGTGNNRFSPLSYYTREQAIATLVRMDAAAVQVTSVTPDRSSLQLSLGEQATIRCTVEPADAMNTQLTWTSSDTSVAKVDAGGTVTAVGPGTAAITATAASGVSGRCTVTVAAPVSGEHFAADQNRTVTVTDSRDGSTTASLTITGLKTGVFTSPSGSASFKTLDVTFELSDVSNGASSIYTTLQCNIYTYDGTLVKSVKPAGQYNPTIYSARKPQTVQFWLSDTQEDTYYRVELVGA